MIEMQRITSLFIYFFFKCAFLRGLEQFWDSCMILKVSLATINFFRAACLKFKLAVG